MIMSNGCLMSNRHMLNVHYVSCSIFLYFLSNNSERQQAMSQFPLFSAVGSRFIFFCSANLLLLIACLLTLNPVRKIPC